jgi:hypothetical protein
MGERLAAAETRIGFARLELSRDRPEEAITLARQAEQVLRTEGSADLEVLAQVALGEALIAVDRLADAEAALARARELTAQADDPRGKLHCARLACLLTAANASTQELSAALAELDRAADRTEANGFVLDSMSARLIQYTVARRGAADTDSRQRLARLADDAAAKGLKRIERKARALLAE